MYEMAVSSGVSAGRVSTNRIGIGVLSLRLEELLEFLEIRVLRAACREKKK